MSTLRIKRSAFGLFLLGALCWHSSLLLHAQKTQKILLAQASDDTSHGRYSAAKAEIESAIELDAKQPEPWYQLGLLYGQLADYRNAEQAFRHTLALDPNSAKAHCRLGQTLVAAPEFKEDWAGAVAEFRAALQLDPNYPEAESLLGLGLTHLGDRNAAIATLRHAIQLHPTQASAHLNLALALEEQPEGQAEAVEEYRASLAARPDAPETESSLGTLLLRLGRLPEAEQAFRRALQLDPDLQDAHFGLARVLKADKRPTEAAVELSLGVAQQQRKPDSTQAIRLNNEALQLAPKGDLPGAIADLRRSIQLKPDYGIAKYNLGLVLADSGDFPGAKQQLIDAVSLLPGQATIWFDLGRILARLGDIRGAMQAVFWAAQLSPATPKFAKEGKALHAANPSVDEQFEGPPRFGALSDTVADRLAFAKELRKSGDLLGAIGELQRALILKPGAVDARTALAEVFEALSNWDRAVEEYRKILLVLGDSDVGAHLALAKALLKAGQPQRAAEQFDRVLALQPDSAAARSGLEAARRTPSRP